MEISVEQATHLKPKSLGRLAEEHRQYSNQLEAILAHPHLSEVEEIEAHRLKKLKLKLKDEMEQCARTVQAAQLSS